MFKTVFFGTDIYAAQLLEQLIASDIVSVDLIITQPDKPVGRKKVLTPPPVKLVALEYGIEILQPTKLRTEAKNLESRISNLDQFDVGITTRYGQIIPKEVLEGPKMGLLNIHPSILPEYRGATPIQSALIDGKEETGVAIMKMDEGLDTGPVLVIKKIPIAPDDTYETLSATLTPLSGDALLEVLPAYMDGSLVPQKQDDTKVTHCKQFSKEDGRIDWNTSAQSIYNQFRGMALWPGVWTMLQNKRLKLLDFKPSTKSISAGTVVVEDGTMYIGTGNGSVIVQELQLEGKKSMSTAEFLQQRTTTNLQVL